MELLHAIQRWVHGSIVEDLSAFATTHDWNALVSVLPIGILFGAVHALTPGHGKAVLATYLMGSRLALLKGVGVATALALTHVSSAVILALLATSLVSRTIGGAGRAPLIEDLSGGLLAGIGAWLVIRALWGRTHQHDQRTGMMVGVVAGFVPCPLTLFVMVFALSRNVPEAGVTFALAMLLGITMTLAAVALLTVVARQLALGLFARHGAAFARLSHGLDGLAGALLFIFGLRELMR